MIERFLIASLCSCLLLTSCSKHAERKRIKQAHLELSKHFDVPVPLSFALAGTTTKKSETGYSDYFTYTGSLPITKAVAFYRQEMERAGWDINDLSTEREGFLYCSKPTKQCGIEIRPTNTPNKKNATTISLFVSQHA